LKIACDRCGAAFEAADDQELCAACRDAAAIGDPYKANSTRSFFPLRELTINM
jgi:hypothetical protein